MAIPFDKCEDFLRGRKHHSLVTRIGVLIVLGPRATFLPSQYELAVVHPSRNKSFGLGGIPGTVDRRAFTQPLKESFSRHHSDDDYKEDWECVTRPSWDYRLPLSLRDQSTGEFRGRAVPTAQAAMPVNKGVDAIEIAIEMMSTFRAQRVHCRRVDKIGAATLVAQPDRAVLEISVRHGNARRGLKDLRGGPPFV